MKRHATIIGGSPAEIPRGKGWADASGVKHPASARDLWTPEQLAAADLYEIKPHADSVSPETHDITGATLIADAANLTVWERIDGTEKDGAALKAQLSARIEAQYRAEIEARLGAFEDRLGKVAQGAIIVDTLLENPLANGPISEGRTQLRADAAEYQRLQAVRAAKLAAVEGGDLNVSAEGGWDAV